MGIIREIIAMGKKDELFNLINYNYEKSVHLNDIAKNVFDEESLGSMVLFHLKKVKSILDMEPPVVYGWVEYLVPIRKTINKMLEENEFEVA